MLGRIMPAAAVLAILGIVWWHGYDAGKTAERAVYEAAATHVAEKAKEAAQRQADALSRVTDTINRADEKIEAIKEGLFDETAAPGTCSIDAGWMLRLDQIR